MFNNTGLSTPVLLSVVQLRKDAFTTWGGPEPLECYADSSWKCCMCNAPVMFDDEDFCESCAQTHGHTHCNRDGVPHDEYEAHVAEEERLHDYWMEVSMGVHDCPFCLDRPSPNLKNYQVIDTCSCEDQDAHVHAWREEQCRQDRLYRFYSSSN